jgi:predicted dehydrogenase
MINLPTILVIGVGQLGSRHLQALINLQDPSSIMVIDPSLDSLNLAEQRAKEISAYERHQLTYRQEIKDLPEIDFAVVASSANVRRQIVEDLLSKTNVKNLLLEKVLFQNAQDCIEVGKLLADRNVKTWVNAPRPMWSCYKALKQTIGGEPIQKIMSGGSGWGLACNAYHMLDLVAWLTDSQIMNLSSEFIDKPPIASKRNGFYELTGTLIGSFESGTIFTLSDSGGPPKNTYILIETEDRLIHISEATQKLTLVSGTPLPSDLEEIKFAPEFQSTLTNRVVEDVLQRGDCELASYSQASEIHQKMLNEFAKCFPQTQEGGLSCPIT